MSLDPLLAIAPARVKALLLPLGQIRGDKFSAFEKRLRAENVVRLRDVTADGRPNRTMFSPLAYPDGAILYDLTTHVPPASHLALSPFDLYREPLVVVALADGSELQDASFTKRQSINGTGRSIVEKNVRALHQELELLHDDHPKALVHRVLIFDFPESEDIQMPDESVVAIPPLEQCKRTTLKTVMCDISSLLLAEMTTLAKSYEAMTAIESPGHYNVARLASSGEDENAKRLLRRNSQFSLPGSDGRPGSAPGLIDKAQHRMSMPVGPSRPPAPSSSSTPGTASLRSQLSSPPLTADSIANGTTSDPATPDSMPDISELRETNRDRVSVQGFGPGGANDRWRMKGKTRASIIIGSMYLQAGRWTDALKELMESAAVARSLNDHIWHGKALELIVLTMFLMGWSKLIFQVPTVCLPPQERPISSSQPMEPEIVEPNQPRNLRHLQILLPEMLERILGLYSKVSSENLPPLPLSETTIRFAKILAALHICNGQLNYKSLDIIVTGVLPEKQLTTSPRHIIAPTRQHVIHLLFRAFPSTKTELLTNIDRVSILSGIAAVLGPLGYHRKKAMVMRELVSVLIGGLIEARTRGAAEAGIHPAAGIVSLNGEQHNGTSSLDVGEMGVEKGLDSFLGLLCKAYGIVGFDMKTGDDADSSELADSDEVIFERIRAQSNARLFGFPTIKLNILRACINFSEAMPDFNGMLKYSSDLLRSGGSGIVPGTRREDASALIHADEQARLSGNITRTTSLLQRMGVSNVAAEYWDEFLVRALTLDPLPISRKPIPHARSVLPGAAAGRSSQDINPFIYNPFLKADTAVVDDNLVAGEIANFRITLQNTYDIEVDIESIRLATEGADFEAIPESTILGPYRTLLFRLKGRPKTEGTIKITGAFVKVRGCRERRFPVFAKAYVPIRDEKIKATGLASLDESLQLAKPKQKLEAETLSLHVIQPQPLVIVKSTTLPQCSMMLLEGERRVFSITLQNLSSTPVDFMLFSFKDSTQDALQTALSNRDATPAELYEYELILMKKQALRLPKNNQGRHIAPGGEATFEFEMFGKPGLTSATIQVDYTYLGVPPDQVTEQFYTRQVFVDLMVTVNASVELARFDTLPMSNPLPQPLLERAGATASTIKEKEYCMLLMDLRNSWPNQVTARFEGEDGIVVEENILPGNTNRVVFPIPRVYIDDPHATIPSLNPNRNRQFVVSTSKISPEMVRSGREAFWYREKVLDSIKATWKTTAGPPRSGTIELRSIRLTPRMVETVKIDEIDMDITVEDEEGNSTGDGKVAFVDEFMQLKVQITNRTSRPILPLVRLVPCLRHRPSNVALDFVRKFAWNGTLQQLLPEVGGSESTDFTIGMTALCRGEFEITATVEEVRIWEEPKSSSGSNSEPKQRPRSNTETLVEAALGQRERRMWHCRQPFVLAVRDRD